MSVSAQRQRSGAGVLQEFADSVSQLVTQKFRELTTGLAAAHAHHRALAGIVMTTGNAAHPPLTPRRAPVAGEEPGRLAVGTRGPSRPSEDAERQWAQSGRGERETAERAGRGGALTPPRGSAHARPGLRGGRRPRPHRAARPGTAGATARPRGAAAPGLRPSFPTPRGSSGRPGTPSPGDPEPSRGGAGPPGRCPRRPQGPLPASLRPPGSGTAVRPGSGEDRAPWERGAHVGAVATSTIRPGGQAAACDGQSG